MDDKLGDRMKGYESEEAGRRFPPNSIVMARLDGRAFHTFCRGLEKPFDERFHRLMVRVTRHLVEETNARMGYTQSDEISLVWHQENEGSQIFFDGRVQKMTSVLAAMATAVFNLFLPAFLPEKANLLPMFDCRVWAVPSQTEAANTFLWRELDATRNSILSAGQAHFSHKGLHGKDTAEIIRMLRHELDIDWDLYADWAKRGTWVRRVRVARPFTTAELKALPPKHDARANPDLVVVRWDTQEMGIPVAFTQVTNREGFIFDRKTPEYSQEVLVDEALART